MEEGCPSNLNIDISYILKSENEFKIKNLV